MNEGPPSLTEFRRCAALARSWVARRRGDPAAAERLCAETGERLFDHLDPVRLEPRWVVDLAMQCGFAGRLSERFPASRILSCGYLPAFPETGRVSRIQVVAASPLALPLAAESTDLVASNLGLFWFSDSGPVLGEIRRVLRPGGSLRSRPLGRALSGSFEEVGNGSTIVLMLLILLICMTSATRWSGRDSRM